MTMEDIVEEIPAEEGEEGAEGAEGEATEGGETKPADDEASKEAGKKD